MSQSATPAASEHGGESALRRGDLSVLWATQWTMRMLLGGLFIFAAWNKLHPASSPQAMNGPQTFASSVQAFKLGLPDWAIRASVSVTVQPFSFVNVAGVAGSGHAVSKRIENVTSRPAVGAQERAENSAIPSRSRVTGHLRRRRRARRARRGRRPRGDRRRTCTRG